MVSPRFLTMLSRVSPLRTVYGRRLGVEEALGAAGARRTDRRCARGRWSVTPPRSCAGRPRAMVGRTDGTGGWKAEPGGRRASAVAAIRYAFFVFFRLSYVRRLTVLHCFTSAFSTVCVDGAHTSVSSAVADSTRWQTVWRSVNASASLRTTEWCWAKVSWKTSCRSCKALARAFYALPLLSADTCWLTAATPFRDALLVFSRLGSTVKELEGLKPVRACVLARLRRGG